MGRSYPFGEHLYPVLQDTFPGSYADVALDDFYAAITRVGRSLIRTDAGEVAYNLHIVLRFDRELEMLEGRLNVKDLPMRGGRGCSKNWASNLTLTLKVVFRTFTSMQARSVGPFRAILLATFSERSSMR